MIKQKLIAICLCCVAACFALPTLAADPVRMITVQGHAKRDVVPDQASISVHLESKAKEMAAAKAKNDAKLKKLFEIAGDHQIERRHLKAGHASVRPNYHYRDGKNIFDGYVANMSVSMTVKDTGKVAGLMQSLVDTGVDNIGNVQYSVDNVQALKDEMMLKAIDNAREKAEKLADRLNQSIGKPLQISEGYARHERPQPVMAMAARGAMMEVDAVASAPPAGEQEIQATVTVSFELED